MTTGNGDREDKNKNCLHVSERDKGSEEFSTESCEERSRKKIHQATGDFGRPQVALAALALRTSRNSARIGISPTEASKRLSDHDIGLFALVGLD